MCSQEGLNARNSIHSRFLSSLQVWIHSMQFAAVCCQSAADCAAEPAERVKDMTLGFFLPFYQYICRHIGIDSNNFLIQYGYGKGAKYL